MIREALVSLEEVSCFYRRKESSVLALNEVSIAIPKGRVTSVVGQSGAGKSTLLRVLAGLRTLDAGTLRWSRDEKTVKRSMVFQSDSLFPWLTIRKNVTYPLRFDPQRDRVSKEERKSKVIEMVEKVGLDPKTFLDRFPHELSGGERRRVAIATALVREVDLLLLDEPTTGLDDSNKWKFQDLLRQLSEEKSFTTVVVSHDIEEAVFLADKIVCLHDGRAVLDHPSNLSSPRVRDLRYQADFVDLRHRVACEILKEVHQ